MLGAATTVDLTLDRGDRAGVWSLTTARARTGTQSAASPPWRCVAKLGIIETCATLFGTEMQAARFKTGTKNGTTSNVNDVRRDYHYYAPY
jgi:hypothetical protein